MGNPVVLGRMGVRQQAREMGRQHRTNNRGMSSSMLRNMRARLEKVASKYHFRKPEEPYLMFDTTDAYAYEKTGMQYFIKRSRNRQRMIEMTPGRDLIDVYRNPDKYPELTESEKAKAALLEGKWLSEFNPEFYACVSGWVEEWHHYVTMGKNKNNEAVVMANPGTGVKTWHDRIRCEKTLGERGCTLCDSKWPLVFGNRFWLDFSHGRWFGPIDAQREILERVPIEGGYVYPSYYACGHCNEILRCTFNNKEVSLDITMACPQCGVPVTEDHDGILIDAERHVAQCSDCSAEWVLLSHDEPEGLRRLVSMEHVCLGCGEKTVAVPVYKHMWTEPEDAGKEPLTEWTTHDIFDCQITMYLDDKQLVVKNCIPQDPDPRLFDPKHQGLGQLGSEIAENLAKRMQEPLDLDKVHAPQDPDEDSDFLDLPNLFEAAAKAREDSAEKQKYVPRGRK